MTTPDPSHRPRLVGDRPDYPDPERDPYRDPGAVGRYDDDPAPVLYGSGLTLYAQQRAEEHEARRARLASEQETARQLRAITEQAEEWKAAEHQAYLADAQRTLQRARVEADLRAARGGPDRGPAPSRDRPRDSAPDQVPARPAENGDVEDQGDDPELTASLEEAAAALFRVAPGVSRDDLQTILKVNSYWAKKLHSNRPGAKR